MIIKLVKFLLNQCFNLEIDCLEDISQAIDAIKYAFNLEKR